MKQRNIKICLKVVILGAVAVFCQACSKGEPAAENNEASNAATNSTPSKINWIADGKKYQGEFDANGLACVLRISNWSYYGRSPSFTLGTYNMSTNLFDWCWKGNKTNLMKIELFDSAGKPVEKTVEGMKYGKFLTEQQYEAAFIKYGRHPAFLKRYAFIPSDAGAWRGGYELDSFSLPELFKITQPGEYTLRVQVHMGQMKFPKKTLERIIMPPEVTAKIQIRAVGVPQTNSVSITQTNT